MVVESAQPVQGAAEAQSPPVPYPVMGVHGLPMARQGGGSCVGAGLGAPGGPSWVGAPPVGSASPCTQSVPHWPLPGCSLCSEPQLPLSRHSGQTPAAGSPSPLHPASPPPPQGLGLHVSHSARPGWGARRAGQTWSCLFSAGSSGSRGGSSGGLGCPWESPPLGSRGAVSPLPTGACHPPQGWQLITT